VGSLPSVSRLENTGARPASVALMVAVALVFSWTSLGAAQEGPPDFKFEGAKGPGPVTFSHAQHLQKVKKCAECRMKIFKMQRGQTGPLSMEKAKAGEQWPATTARPCSRARPWPTAGSVTRSEWPRRSRRTG
jgi:c(7)-type cytochrome triheme protein